MISLVVIVQNELSRGAVERGLSENRSVQARRLDAADNPFVRPRASTETNRRVAVCVDKRHASGRARLRGVPEYVESESHKP